ncbi:MAG: hypothetical protein E7472_01240 [Ruminococcaceae bacterium]|nr:hypothetical protein [Oscillospiraceae bacterium]
MNLKTTKIICFIFLGVFLVVMLAMGITMNTMFGYAAIAVMAIYGIFNYGFWRCPSCKKNIGPLWVKHCPNCGKKIS